MSTTFKTTISDILTKPAARLAQARGLHLLRIQVRGTESAPVIEVMLDGNRAITIDDCETVSKEMSSEIDSVKLVKGNYRLDVMSPGLEEPLVEDWQFERSLGRLVEAQYREDAEHHTVHGHLRTYTEKEIAIEPVHVKKPKILKPNRVTTDSGPIAFEKDEQLYDEPVELVRIDRKHLVKVIAQPEFA